MNNKAIVYKSIVDESIIKEFEEWRGDTLYEHSSNSNCIDGFISAACVLCPDIIDVDGYIFLLDFINRVGNQDDDPIEKVGMWKKQFNNDKRKIEQWVNSWNFGGFFNKPYSEKIFDPYANNEKVLYQFGDILVYNWTRRFKELFPDRNIIVEYGDDIEGEEGLTITVYEA